MALVCATDLSEPAARAADVAAALARRSKDRLVLVQAALLPDPEHRGDEESSPLRLKAEADRLRTLHSVEVEPIHEHGTPETVLFDQIARVQAELLVVGSRGRRGFRRFFVGSTAERLVRLSPVPVLVVRPEKAEMLLQWAAGHAPLRIVVGLGLDECADAPLEIASRLSRFGSCRLDFVHALEPMPLAYSGVPPDLAPWAKESEARARRELIRLVDEKQLGGDVDVELGKPASTVSSIAERRGAGLAIVGSHGRRGLDRLLLGSVSAGVLRQAPCSVVVAPCDWHAAATTESRPPAET